LQLPSPGSAQEGTRGFSAGLTDYDQENSWRIATSTRKRYWVSQAWDSMPNHRWMWWRSHSEMPQRSPCGTPGQPLPS